jgi:hypothetical protein
MAIPVLGQIHFIGYVIPATAGIIRFPRLSRAMRILTLLCVLACIDIAAQYLVALWGMKNYFISDYYRVIEVSLLCVVFYLSTVSKGTRIVLRGLGILFVVIWVVDMIFFRDPDRINSGMAMTSRTFLIVMALATLHSAIKDERSHLLERPVFWVVMGVVLYSAGTLLVVGLSNQLLALGKVYFDVAWHINWSLLIIANLLYTKGMLCKSQA